MSATARTARSRRVLKAGLTAALAVAATTVPLLVPASAGAASGLVSDGFDRTVATGWGRAASGSSWVTSGAGTVSVAGSAGRVAHLPHVRSFSAYQTGVSATDVEVSAQFRVSTGKDFQYSLSTRRQSDGSSYVGRMRVDAQGKVQLELMRNRAGALTYLKGAAVDVGSVSGSDLVLEVATTSASPVIVQAKLYRAGTPEPGWQLTALDESASALTKAGSLGVGLYNGPANGSVDVSTSSFVARQDPESGELLTDPTTTSSSTSTPSALHVSHGAGAVGSARYPVPADALVVSPNGSDSAAGTLDRPFKTLAKALTRNRAGQTIVLRAGTYHESVVVAPGHAATIQPYPGEKVWFDGSRDVSGFQASGSTWVAPWTVKLDASPTYTKGAPDSSTPGWQFVDPAHPMAAHPDMVWVGGQELAQVRSRSLVTAGTFYVDQAAGQLVLGTNPTGKPVQSSDLQSAFSLRAPGTVLRGFGIRRYADSVWQQGVVTAYYPSMTLDDVTVQDSATAGIGFYKPGSVIKNTTVARSGQLGIQASYADGLVMDNVSVTDSNDEHFNPAPSAGGIKITTTRTVTLRNSEILRSSGNQFWADESTHDIILTGNEIMGGSRWGAVLEISSGAALVDNVIADNAYDGVMVQDTDNVRIWNNTIVRNRQAVTFVQDSRRITQLGVAGHDKRRAQPDLSMPWVIGRSTVSNNVLAADKGATSVLGVESYQHTFDADDLGISVNGNVYAQTALGLPAATITWARQGAQPSHFVLLSDFRDATGQERAGVHAVMSTPVDGAFRLKSLISARTATVAQALPLDLGEKAGRAPGSKRIGAWDRPVS